MYFSQLDSHYTDYPFKISKKLPIVSVMILVPQNTSVVHISKTTNEGIFFSVDDTEYAFAPVSNYTQQINKVNFIYSIGRDTNIGYVVFNKQIPFPTNFTSSETGLLETTFLYEPLDFVRTVSVEDLDGKFKDIGSTPSIVQGQNTHINGLEISAINIPEYENYLKGFRLSPSILITGQSITIFGEKLIRIFGDEFSTILDAFSNNCPTVFGAGTKGEDGDQGPEGDPGITGANAEIFCLGDFEFSDCINPQEDCSVFDSLCCVPNFAATTKEQLECCCPQGEVCCTVFVDECIVDDFPDFPTFNFDGFGFGDDNCPLDNCVVCDSDNFRFPSFPVFGFHCLSGFENEDNFEQTINVGGVVTFTRNENTLSENQAGIPYLNYKDDASDATYFTLQLGNSINISQSYILKVTGATFKDTGEPFTFYALINSMPEHPVNGVPASVNNKIYFECPSTFSANPYTYYCNEETQANFVPYSSWVTENGSLRKALFVVFSTGTIEEISASGLSGQLFNTDTLKKSNTFTILFDGPTDNEYVNENYYVDFERFGISAISSQAYMYIDNNSLDTTIVPTSLVEGFASGLSTVGSNVKVYDRVKTNIWNREAPKEEFTTQWRQFKQESITSKNSLDDNRTTVVVDGDVYYEGEYVFAETIELIGGQQINRVHRIPHLDVLSYHSHHIDVAPNIYLTKLTFNHASVEIIGDTPEDQVERIHNGERRKNQYTMNFSEGLLNDAIDEEEDSYELLVFPQTEKNNNPISKSNIFADHKSLFTQMQNQFSEDEERGLRRNLVAGEMPSFDTLFANQQATYFNTPPDVAYHQSFTRYAGHYSKSAAETSRVVRVIYQDNANFLVSQNFICDMMPAQSACDWYGWKQLFEVFFGERYVFGANPDADKQSGIHFYTATEFLFGTARQVNSLVDDYTVKVEATVEVVIDEETEETELQDLYFTLEGHELKFAQGIMFPVSTAHTTGLDRGAPILSYEITESGTYETGDYSNVADLYVDEDSFLIEADDKILNHTVLEPEKVFWGYPPDQDFLDEYEASSVSNHFNIHEDIVFITEDTTDPQQQYLGWVTFVETMTSLTLEFYDYYDPATRTYNTLHGSIDAVEMGEKKTHSFYGDLLFMHTAIFENPCYGATTKEAYINGNIHPYRAPELKFVKPVIDGVDGFGGTNIMAYTHKQWKFSGMRFYEHFDVITKNGFSNQHYLDQDSIDCTAHLVDPYGPNDTMDVNRGINEDADDWYIILFGNDSGIPPEPNSYTTFPPGVDIVDLQELILEAFPEFSQATLNNMFVKYIGTNATIEDTVNTMTDDTYFPGGHGKTGMLTFPDTSWLKWNGSSFDGDFIPTEDFYNTIIENSTTFNLENEFTFGVLYEKWGSTGRVSRTFDSLQGGVGNPIRVRMVGTHTPDDSDITLNQLFRNTSDFGFNSPVYKIDGDEVYVDAIRLSTIESTSDSSSVSGLVGYSGEGNKILVYNSGINKWEVETATNVFTKSNTSFDPIGTYFDELGISVSVTAADDPPPATVDIEITADAYTDKSVPEDIFPIEKNGLSLFFNMTPEGQKFYQEDYTVSSNTPDIHRLVLKMKLDSAPPISWVLEVETASYWNRLTNPTRLKFTLEQDTPSNSPVGDYSGSIELLYGEVINLSATVSEVS